LDPKASDITSTKSNAITNLVPAGTNWTESNYQYTAEHLAVTIYIAPHSA
jgi:hypothetical protein